MAASPLSSLSRLALHTMTNQPWTLAQCVRAYAAAGIGAVSVWRNVLEPLSIGEAARILGDAGMVVPSLVRGGFFPALDARRRQAAIDETRRCIDQARGIDAQMVVLVAGAVPGMAMSEARRQVADGIGAILGHARSAGVRLAIEPLHPMYAADRSCVNRMAEARQICQQLGGQELGIAVDVYHVWWDPQLEQEIERAGREGTLLALHLCDWRVPTRDLLNDRALMGEGCIDLRRIRASMEDAGFRGFHEVEIFSLEHWAGDQAAYLERIKRAYLEHV